MGGIPRTVSELYPSKWLSPADLPRPVMATIERVDIEQFRQQDGSQEARAVITFRNASKRMVCNVTQCRRLAELLETETFSGWIGARVKLAAGRAQNGKPTIIVAEAVRLPAAPAGQGQQPPGPATRGIPQSTGAGQQQQPPTAEIPQSTGSAAGMSEAEVAALWESEPADG